MLKLREIYRYELEYRRRSASTWIYAAFLCFITFMVFHATADSDVLHLNAPVRLAGLSVTVGLMGILVTAALFGDAAVRDAAVEMNPLLFTTPIRKIEFLGGRFLAALTVNALVALAIPLGLGLGLLTARGLNPADPVGPFRLTAFLQPFLFFTLPNLVLVGVILFSIAALTRQIVPVYLGALGVLISYVTAANYAPHVHDPLLITLFDPLGLGTLQEMSRYWTVAEQNTRLIGLPAALAGNRVAWLAIAAGVFALLHRVFRLERAGGGGKRERRHALLAVEATQPAPLSVPRVTPAFGMRTTVRQTLAIAHYALAEVAASRWFVVALLACVGLPLLWGWNVGSTVFDTSTWPVTLLVTEVVLSSRSVLVPHLLVALYAGELVWKDREAGVAEIADASPVPEGAALLGRFLAAVAMLVLFLGCFIIGGLLIQVLQGYYRFEPGLYLRVVFGLNLIEYVLLAALAMTIHVLVNQKYIGHLCVVLAFLFTKVAPAFGIRHNLLVYNGDPGWTYSDMNGFGPFIAPFVWFKLYWAAWVVVLGLVAVVFWVRGREDAGRRRLRVARARFTGPVLRTAAVAAALILGLGGFIFYNTNVLNEYRSGIDTGAPKAEYEKRYGRYADLPQPTIVSAGLRVEIYPDTPAVELRGSFRLVNRTDRSIDSVHVYLNPAVRARSLAFDRGAREVLADDDVGYRIYALAQPLEPGASTQLSFDLSFRPRGFPNNDVQTDVVANGAYFHRTWLPFIGYQPMFELSNAKAREHFGLAPKAPVKRPDDPGPHPYHWSWRDADLVQVDAIIGTTADQIALTPGVLQRSWTERGRRYFHYTTAQPTAFGGTIFSGKYELLQDRWRDIPLSIYYHASHGENLDRMVRGMKAALEYCTAEFGPYPDNQLRIVEIPRYGGFGHAHPHTVAFTEDVFFSRVRDGEIDQPFYGTAHEVAHTWWGGMIRGPADVLGGGFLTESLANYSAMMVTEKTFGPAVARRVYGFQMERYLLGRAQQAREVPLVQVEDQPYIAYRKGAIAMYTLREHIGEARVNSALRSLQRKFGAGVPPYPTSLDLLAELRAVTPDSLRYLLTDWFETVTLWSVETRSAAVQPAPNGQWLVTLEVVAKKVRADAAGAETEVPMNDLVDIGVFGADKDLGQPIYLQRHRIRSGAQTIRITVGREPARAGIDPWRRLIDRERADNMVAVSMER